MKILPWIIGIGLLAGIGTAGYFYVSGSSLSLPAAVQQAKDTPAQLENTTGLQTYTDSTYGFTLSYPTGYHVANIEGDSEGTIVVQDEKGVGMQLVVTLFDETNDTLTPARIKQDLPDLPMLDVREVSLPTAHIPAVVFKSSGGGFGDSVELWFVYDGYLYQASTYASQIGLLEGIMGTFRF